MSKKYCVIIGDIVQSKEIIKRKSLQRKFHNILAKINKDFSSQIVSKFVVTIGDEFQGVLKDLSQSYEIIDAVQEMFYPVKLRFGVGQGRITTQVKKTAIGMDGPVFHNARNAVEKAKNQNKSIVFQVQPKQRDIALNSIALAISGLKQSWTERQFEAVKFYKKYGIQAKAAKAMRIDRTTLTKMLKAAKWELIAELEKQTNELCGLF